jgi:hypothetical protein
MQEAIKNDRRTTIGFVTECLPEVKAQLHEVSIYDWCNQVVEPTTPEDSEIVFIP